MLAPVIAIFAFATACSLLLLLFILLVKKLFDSSKRRSQYLQFISGKGGLSDRTPKEFVDLVAELFRRENYSVEITEGLKDKGADLLLRRNGETTVVQVKHWRKPVGMSAVREVVASKPHYKATKAMVVCSTKFTQNSIALASDNRVQLFDELRLIKLVEKQARDMQKNRQHNFSDADVQ